MPAGAELPFVESAMTEFTRWGCLGSGTHNLVIPVDSVIVLFPMRTG